MAAPQDLDIAVWLATVHLEQYADTFRQHGLATAAAARGLGHEELKELGVSATGHRKRILRLLQASTAEGFLEEATPLDNAMEPSPSSALQAPLHKPVPKPRTVFGGLSGPSTTQRPGLSPALGRPELSRSPESSPPLPTSDSEQPAATMSTVEMMPNAIYFGLDFRGRAQAAQDV